MSVAKSYARALYDTAQTGNGSRVPLEQVRGELESVVSALTSSREAQIALTSPATSTREKVAVVEAFSSRGNFSQLTRQFLLLLARKERLSILDEVVHALEEVRLEATGGILGRVVSADPMESADVASLADAFTRKLGRKVELRAAVDSNLLAGVRVTVNGVTYDGTLRSQLERLRERVVQGASLVE